MEKFEESNPTMDDEQRMKRRLSDGRHSITTLSRIRNNMSIAGLATCTTTLTCPWVDGLECIDSLLVKGSATSIAMTDQQRNGLKSVKAMILFGETHGSNTVLHAPQELLEDAGPNSQTSDFLLSEYGGITRPGKRHSLRAIVSAKKCAIKIAKMFKKKHDWRYSLIDCDQAAETIPSYWLTLEDESKLKVRDLLSWENLSKWSFNIFDVHEVLKGKNVLVFVAWAIIAAPEAQHAMDLACSNLTVGQQKLENDENEDEDEVDATPRKIMDFNDREGYQFLSKLFITEGTLVEFLVAIENRYNSDVSYHNEVHAADVVQSLHALLQMGGKKFAATDWELFSVLIAAVCHDVGHSGVNNNFHINSRSELALLYNDESPLENMHAATTFQLIMGENRDEKLDIFARCLAEDVTKAKAMIIKVILSTDMKKHFSKMNFIQGLVMNNNNDDADDGITQTPCFDHTCMDTRHDLLSFLCHMADISNATKDIAITTKWCHKVLEEFYNQGELEKELNIPISPNCDRDAQTCAQSQIGFIKFIILPSFTLLGQLLPQVEEEIVPQIEKNLKIWGNRREQELQS